MPGLAATDRARSRPRPREPASRNLRLLAPVAPAPRAPSTSLLERARELAALEDGVRRLTAGQGSVVVLEAASAVGKTALLDHAARAAELAGFLVRRATPAPSERDLAFGVMRALLEGPVRRARTDLLEGAAGPAAALVLAPALPAPEPDLALAHSFLWLADAVAGGRGLALIIDDAQWSDAASLEALSYLARRIDDVPVLLVIATRPGAVVIGGLGAATVLRPEPLSQTAIARLVQRPAERPPAERAWLAVASASASAEECAALAVQALEDGVLLESAWHDAAYHQCVLALIMADAAGPASRAIANLRDRANARASRPMLAVAAWYDAELALRRGDLKQAERLGSEALELAGESGQLAAGPRAVLISVLAERGRFDEAQQLLQGDRAPGTAVLHARARLRLGEGRFADAYADACEVGARRARQGRTNPTFDGWRSTAAMALAHVGRREEAVRLAEADLAAGSAYGAPVPLARALAARALAERDARARVELCVGALGRLADRAAGLDAVRLRLELGSALIRLGRRAQAREPLRQALAEADRAGADLLAARARRELVATGLRPRRPALNGSGALTPRQLQICELAAAGKGNPAIANELFLSIKTVETHLAAAYRKLGVRTRGELTGTLGTL